MKNSVVGISLILLLCVGVWAQTEKTKSSGGDVGKMLIDKENQMDKAMQAGNWKGATEYMADDFVASGPKGETNREGWIAEMKGTKSNGLSNMKAHMFGPDVAVVTGEFSGTAPDKNGKPQAIKVSWVDTWMKRNGQWKMIATSGELMD